MAKHQDLNLCYLWDWRRSPQTKRNVKSIFLHGFLSWEDLDNFSIISDAERSQHTKAKSDASKQNLAAVIYSPQRFSYLLAAFGLKLDLSRCDIFICYQNVIVQWQKNLSHQELLKDFPLQISHQLCLMCLTVI